MTATVGKVVSVNVGPIREFEYNGRPATSAIWKTPVTGRIPIQGVNCAGDDQADRTVHGGPDKAVYVYAVEDTRWWEQELGRPLDYGQFGENLTIEGIDPNTALIGERWSIGSTVLAVSEPRIPCWKLGVRMEDKSFPQQFTAAQRSGLYLRILQEGDVGAGDQIQVLDKPDHTLTIQDIVRIYNQDRAEAGRLLEVPQVSEGWRAWAEQWVQRNGGA